MNQAIDVLNALSKGDTGVDIEVRGNDEVGRIATTVSSFRKSLIEREKARNLFGKYIPQTIAEKLLKEDGLLYISLPNIENFEEVYDFLKKHGISTQIKSHKSLENLIDKFHKKKNNSQQIIKKLAYTGNQILLNNEKEIIRFC